MRRRPAVRLSRRHERLVVSVALLVASTGLCWLVVHYLVARPDEFGVVHDPREPWLLRLHGAASMAALFFLGSLAREHALAAWHMHRHRLSGGVLILACTLLVMTGYALYYVTSDLLRPVISVLHWGIGLAAVPAFVLHHAVGRLRRERRRSPGGARHRSRAQGRAGHRPATHAEQ